jgi:hypothetical protein
MYQTASRDRRRSTRSPHLVEAWIVSPTAVCESERLEIMSVNISRHGVAFVSKAPMPVRAYFKLEIAFESQRICSEVRIVSCQRCPDGTWSIGAEFC